MSANQTVVLLRHRPVSISIPGMAYRMLDDLGGKLLVAMPDIGDDRFQQAVILICSHGPDYAMGLVLNKPMPGLSLPTLLEQLDVESEITLADAPVLDGGPVGRDRGFVLHSPDFVSDDSTLEVTDNICLTATREALHAIAGRHAPREALLALGYAGWGEGQLEMELSSNVWLVSEPDHDLIYGTRYEAKWERALARIGVSPWQLSGETGRA